MDPRVRRLVQVTTGVSLGLLVAWVFAIPRGTDAAHFGPEPDGIGTRAGADVPLLDMHEQAVSLATYQGEWTLLFFGFTHCPDICPVTLQRLKAGMDELGSRGAGVEPVDVAALRVLLVTVDPERDTPAALAEYLEAFGPRFTGLTGTLADLERLRSAFDVTVQRDPVAHTARIHVLDPTGRWVDELPPWPGAGEMADAMSSILGRDS